MAEYIDRDIFLSCERNQYCMNCKRRKNEKGKFVYAIGDAPCRACGIGDVLDDAEDFPAADAIELGRWIPVAERLPEDSHDVFVVTDGLDVGTGYMYQPNGEDRRVWATPFADIEPEHITHWMPLPHPPQRSHEE